jgi:outer membrane lipoprotein-sorting protein
VPDDDQAAVLFLSGRGNLTRDFNVAFGQNPSKDVWTLRLEPKRPQQEYDWLEITASRDNLRIQSLTVSDKQGNRSTFHFTNFKENPGLTDKQFGFSIPRGAEVTNAGPAKR